MEQLHQPLESKRTNTNSLATFLTYTLAGLSVKKAYDMMKAGNSEAILSAVAAK